MCVSVVESRMDDIFSVPYLVILVDGIGQCFLQNGDFVPEGRAPLQATLIVTKDSHPDGRDLISPTSWCIDFVVLMGGCARVFHHDIRLVGGGRRSAPQRRINVRLVTVWLPLCQFCIDGQVS